jgi:hypothetical protein
MESWSFGMPVYGSGLHFSSVWVCLQTLQLGHCATQHPLMYIDWMEYDCIAHADVPGTSYHCNQGGHMAFGHL